MQRGIAQQHHEVLLDKYESSLLQTDESLLRDINDINAKLSVENNAEKADQLRAKQQSDKNQILLNVKLLNEYIGDKIRYKDVRQKTILDAMKQAGMRF